MLCSSPRPTNLHVGWIFLESFPVPEWSCSVVVYPWFLQMGTSFFFFFYSFPVFQDFFYPLWLLHSNHAGSQELQSWVLGPGFAVAQPLVRNIIILSPSSTADEWVLLSLISPSMAIFLFLRKQHILRVLITARDIRSHLFPCPT